jgi:hypothetical protein
MLHSQSIILPPFHSRRKIAAGMFNPRPFGMGMEVVVGEA